MMWSGMNFFLLIGFQRVKVYRMNDDGKWDDKGTGHVTVDYLERLEELGLFVFDEEDNENILSHRISPDDIYRKQEDTIISWRDPEYAAELALSFQESGGCSYIWDNICNVQRSMHFNTLNSEAFNSVNSESRELPAVELSTLPLILKMVVESGNTDHLRLVELILSYQDFFGKLMDVFRVCEDLENMDGLHMIYKIVKGIILLNSTQIFERIFSDEFMMDIIGALEYDPEVSHVKHHRKFLKEHVIFKEAIPIKNTTVLSKIHQTYRVGFLKDVVLARVLDEATVANLNSIIHANNAIVVSLLKDDNTFIQELFARLKSPATSPESKKNMVHFLHEFCSLSKSLQMVHQLRFFSNQFLLFDCILGNYLGRAGDLMNEGVFDIVTDVLQSQDKKLVLTGTDILILFLNQDPNLLQSYVVQQEGITLLGLLVRGMITDFGDDMHCQFLEILRCLLDSCSLSGAQSEDPLPQLYICINPILTFRHGVALQDEHLVDHFVRSDLLKPIVDAFVANGNRYNLLHSAVLELFEYIRKENLKLLLKYIVDSFWDQLVKFEYLVSIHSLKVKYEQCLDNDGAKGTAIMIDLRRRLDERALEKEEEDYFNDSDEEDTTSASISHNQKVQQQQPALSNGVAASYSELSPRSGGLVDYDDDDDEDYRPPPKKKPEASEEDEGTMESLSRKRKLPSKNPELAKKLSKNSKSKDSVFAALCSTLSQAVLPGKKPSINVHTDPCREDNKEKEPNVSRNCCENSNATAEANHVEKETSAYRNFSDGLYGTSDNGQLGGEEHTLVSPKSSPEMAVNGS
ncbi:Serine/threonine-protein phosphatase 4 regulatory subunit 3 [Glycine max]|nr:Serine/threonine-protein phosphatase 4 regulatory subunit 3 [Glycine max]